MVLPEDDGTMYVGVRYRACGYSYVIHMQKRKRETESERERERETERVTDTRTHAHTHTQTHIDTEGLNTVFGLRSRTNSGM